MHLELHLPGQRIALDAHFIPRESLGFGLSYIKSESGSRSCEILFLVGSQRYVYKAENSLILSMAYHVTYDEIFKTGSRGSTAF